VAQATTEIPIVEREDEETAAAGAGRQHASLAVCTRSIECIGRTVALCSEVALDFVAHLGGFSVKLDEGRSGTNAASPFVFAERLRFLARISSRNSGFLE
jgi:hypothetical protein